MCEERTTILSDMENTASRRVMEKLGMKHEKDVDLYDSVAKGEGLLPFYSIEREAYFRVAQIHEGYKVSDQAL